MMTFNEYIYLFDSSVVVFLMEMYCFVLSSGKVLFRRSHIRDVAVKRLKHLDNYCKVRRRPHVTTPHSQIWIDNTSTFNLTRVILSTPYFWFCVLLEQLFIHFTALLPEHLLQYFPRQPSTFISSTSLNRKATALSALVISCHQCKYAAYKGNKGNGGTQG